MFAVGFCFGFFYSVKMNKIRIEVANNLPFAKFYIACIQTHYVHKYVTWEACRHFKNEESRNPVYFGL